mgnify:CR=1 FL=1
MTSGDVDLVTFHHTGQDFGWACRQDAGAHARHGAVEHVANGAQEGGSNEASALDIYDELAKQVGTRLPDAAVHPDGFHLVMPVARKVWQPMAVSMPASCARRPSRS